MFIVEVFVSLCYFLLISLMFHIFAKSTKNEKRVNSQSRRRKDDPCLRNPGGRTSGLLRKPRPLSSEIHRPNSFLGLSRKSFSLKRRHPKSEYNDGESTLPSDWVKDFQVISTNKIQPNIKVENGRIEFVQSETGVYTSCQGNKCHEITQDITEPNLSSESNSSEMCKMEAKAGSSETCQEVNREVNVKFRNRRPKSYSMDYSSVCKGEAVKDLLNETKLLEVTRQHDPCQIRMTNLQEDVKRMEEMVYSMIHYRNMVNELQAEKSNIAEDLEEKITLHQNKAKELEAENESLKNEVRMIKDQENESISLLRSQIKMLEQENTELKLDNEQLKRIWERCFDDVAKQMVQTLLVHKTLKEECARLHLKNKALTDIIGGDLEVKVKPSAGCRRFYKAKRDIKSFRSRLPVPSSKIKANQIQSSCDATKCDKPGSGDQLALCDCPNRLCCLSPISLPSPQSAEHPCSPAPLSSSWTYEIDPNSHYMCPCANTIVPVRFPNNSKPSLTAPFKDCVSLPPDVVPTGDSLLWSKQSSTLRSGEIPSYVSDSGTKAATFASPTIQEPSINNSSKDEGYSTMSSDVQLDKSQTGNPCMIHSDGSPTDTVVSKLSVCKQKIQSLNIVIESVEPCPVPQTCYVSQMNRKLFGNCQVPSESVDQVPQEYKVSQTPPEVVSGNKECVKMSRSLECDHHIKVHHSQSSPLKRWLSDSEMCIVKPLYFDKRAVLSGMSGNSLPECSASISDVSMDLDKSFSPHLSRTLVTSHLPYDQNELEDWTFDEDAKKFRYHPYMNPVMGSLPSIKENSLELEEDSTECLWTPTYFCDEGHCEHLDGQCNRSWDYCVPRTLDERDDLLITHSQLSILDKKQLWPGDWESSLCGSKEHLASHPSLQDLLAQADGDFKLKCSGNDSEFRPDFYQLVKLESNKSLCSSSKSILADQEGCSLRSQESSLSELSPPDREVALHSVLKFLAEQRQYFQSLELEDQKDFRLTSDKSTEATLTSECSPLSSPTPEHCSEESDKDTGLVVQSVISNLQDLLRIDEVDEEDEVIVPNVTSSKEEEGTVTNWFHFEADTDLSDPKTRANILDTMVDSSSQSDEGSDLDASRNESRHYQHCHRLHRLRRQKKVSRKGMEVFRLAGPHRPTILDYRDLYTRYEKEEREAVASFDFLDDLSGSISEVDSSQKVTQEELKQTLDLQCLRWPVNSCLAADLDEVRCLSRCSNSSFNSQNQDVLPEAFLFSDSCAASCCSTSNSSREDLHKL